MFNGMNGLEILKNWPRFDDGDPVEFGDEFQNAHGGASVLRTVLIKDCRDSLGGDFYWKLGKGKNAVTLKSGERVKRPAPKVYDTDGVEIHKGDTWERWIEDADKSPCEYFGSFGPSCDGCRRDPYTCDSDKDRDLVRRAKALAGVSE